MYAASRRALAGALLVWVVVIAGLLAASDGAHAELAETGYRMATGMGLMALAWFGLLNIRYGLLHDFSVSQVVLTLFALGLGGFGVHVAFSTLALAPFLAAAALFVLGEAAVVAWLRRRIRRATRQALRDEAGSNNPAERFERRLIRHVERALEVEAVAQSGTNSRYWSFRLPGRGEVVEMSVIGPGYNTSAPVRPGERWLLRVREPKPALFTPWIARHFGADDAGTTRDLGAQQQTQFASSLLADDRAFFDAAIPWQPPAEADERPAWVMHVVRLSPGGATADDDETAAPEKPTIH